ncbi:MAG: hypothetical protein ACKVS6_07070 [Planctomycetota bacterium]
MIIWNSQAEYTNDPSTSLYTIAPSPNANRTHRVWVLNPVGPTTIQIDLGFGAAVGSQDSTIVADLFCSGHTWAQDGTLVIGGGLVTVLPNGQPQGAKKTVAFNPNAAAGSRFSFLADTQQGRWYPTLLTLANGNILTFSGLLDACFTVPPSYNGPLLKSWETLQLTTDPQYPAGQWQQFSDSTLPIDGWHYYSRAHVIAGGKVFVPFDVHVGVPTNLIGVVANPYTMNPEICYEGWPKLEVASFYVNIHSPAQVTIPTIRPSQGRHYGNSVHLVDLSNPGSPTERILTGYGSPLAPTNDTTTPLTTYPPPPPLAQPPAALNTIDEYNNPATSGGAWISKGAGGIKTRFNSNAVILPDGTVFTLAEVKMILRILCRHSHHQNSPFTIQSYSIQEHLELVTEPGPA